MAKKGTGLLMVWADVPAGKEEEFNRWYNEEHLPERMAIPGFLSGARYEAVKGGPKHLAYYELESAEILQSPAYKKVQANPTEWTKRSGPGTIATTFIRNVYPDLATLLHGLECARLPAVWYTPPQGRAPWPRRVPGF